MALLSARLAAAVARQLPQSTSQIAKVSWPALQVGARQIHVSCSQRAAEISSILEERILGSAPKANLEETGRVLSIGDGIARVYGLKNIQADEMVEFSSGLKLVCVVSVRPVRSFTPLPNLSLGPAPLLQKYAML
ncbi:UNVERIFIED_CONTAM: hypothetical protein B566_EDAN018891 [Ephemera danica]|nr:hypothetical protein B566_EDAN018891 [Ephemera danica]